MMLPIEAPKIFRIPISFVRCSAVKMIRPSKPRHEIKMANDAKALEKLLIICSLLYNF